MGDYKVYATIERPDPTLVERLRQVHFQIILIYAKIGPSQIIDTDIQPLAGNRWPVCGPAVTVQLDEPDHLMPSAASKVCQPGDVLVIAANGSKERAVWGGTLTRAARFAGVTAIIADGMVECYQPILDENVPVYCRGVYPKTGDMNKPGSINVPVVCGGVVVNPGDIIVGNEDGLAVVRPAQVAPIIDLLEERTARRRDSIAQGRENRTNLFDLRNGFDRLRELGVEWID